MEDKSYKLLQVGLTRCGQRHRKGKCESRRFLQFAPLFAEVLLISQYGPGEIVKATRAKDDPTMAEGRSHRHGDDLADVDYMKRHRFRTVYFHGERDSPVTS